MINENEKYFLNSSHAALNSFQSSGRITRDIRFSPRLGLHPNFCSISLRKNFVYPKRCASCWETELHINNYWHKVVTQKD